MCVEKFFFRGLVECFGFLWHVSDVATKTETVSCC